MLVKPMSSGTNGVLRRLAAAVALCAGLAVTSAYAQVNIDQGKSPAEIYASDCATCHKTPRGLAVGKNSLMLSSFLREHYTASTDQAAALAAYVLSAGGREPVAKPKPETEHARAGEKLKPAEPKPAEPKPAELKNHPVRAASAKPEEPNPTKPEQAEGEVHPASDSGGAEHEDKSSPAAEVAPAGPTMAAAPSVNAPPPDAVAETHDNPEPAKTASVSVPNIELGSTMTLVPPAHQSKAGPPVPRDNIPD